MEIEEEMEIELLKAGAKSAEWVEKNFDKLAKRYRDRLVAVEGERVVASSGDMEDLMAQIKKKGKDPALVYIVSFPSEAFIL